MFVIPRKKTVPSLDIYGHIRTRGSLNYGSVFRSLRVEVGRLGDRANPKRAAAGDGDGRLLRA